MFKKGFAKNNPIKINRQEITNPKKRVVEATWLASSCRPSPNLLDRRLLIPTPVPTAAAINKFCIGKANETAVKAVSETIATNMLSTTL